MKGIAAYLPVESTQHWARGCENCTHGIVAAPELTGSCELYLERLAQAMNGDIEFCTCHAGVKYRAFLLARHKKLVEEAKKDKRMVKWAAAKTHPEIEWAQARILNSYSMATMPTIHYEPEQAELA